MKLFIVTLLFPLTVFCRTQVTIQQDCNNQTNPLIISEGDFTQERQNRFPQHIKTWEGFIHFLDQKIIDTQEFLEISMYLSNIYEHIEKAPRERLRSITVDDLLIDQTASCSYSSIFEINKNGIIKISKKFDELKKQDQFIHILELIHLPFIKNYSDVGTRNYIYSMLAPNFNLISDKAKVDIKANAGFDVFYKYRAQIDIARIKYYNEKDDSIEIAFLKEGSIVETPNGQCRASIIRPALFEDGILKVFSIKDICQLIIGNKRYQARKDSVIKLRNHGLFINEPLPTFIESIYVTTDTIINTENVRLKASLDPKKKSKIKFHLDGSGEIEGYIQFLGMVNYQGKFYKIEDYHNLWRSSHRGPFQSMVLAESIKITDRGLTNEYIGHIVFDENKKLTRGTITGKAPKVLVKGKAISVLSGSEIHYFSSTAARAYTPMILVLGKNTRLHSQNGETILYPKGLKINLTAKGFVKLH